MKQVDVFTTTGMFGVLPRHVPSIAVLRPSVVTVHEESDNKNKIFGEFSVCAEGFVTEGEELVNTIDFYGILWVWLAIL